MRLTTLRLAVGLLLAVCGCAIDAGSRVVDVTNEPAFQRSGYAAGQDWTVRADAYLVHVRPPGDAPAYRMLCSASTLARMRSNTDGSDPNDPELDSVIAAVPRGSTIHIDRLQYAERVVLFRHLSLFDVGPDFRLMEALGTLVVPTGQWPDVISPGSPVVGSQPDGVLLMAPNRDLLVASTGDARP